MSIDELAKHRDDKRKAINLSKAKLYPLLESPPDPAKGTDFYCQSAGAEGSVTFTVMARHARALHRLQGISPPNNKMTRLLQWTDSQF